MLRRNAPDVTFQNVQFLSFGKVFDSFGQQLKLSNFSGLKIARFGVQWIEFWHEDCWKAALGRALVIYQAGWFVYSPLGRFVIDFVKVWLKDSTQSHQGTDNPRLPTLFW